jgi:hypothetical protein
MKTQDILIFGALGVAAGFVLAKSGVTAGIGAASDGSVAREILNQLGGNRFLAMTGSKNLMHSNNGLTLSMHLARNKSTAKYLQITLDPNDTYTMVFSKLTGKKNEETLVEVARYEGVYADMLQSIFTDVTGFDTRL